MTDVDECADSSLNNCHSRATCTDTDGSFTCTCNDGYAGNGVTCEGIAVCIPVVYTCLILNLNVLMFFLVKLVISSLSLCVSLSAMSYKLPARARTSGFMP